MFIQGFIPDTFNEIFGEGKSYRLKGNTINISIREHYSYRGWENVGMGLISLYPFFHAKLLVCILLSLWKSSAQIRLWSANKKK